MHSLAERGVPLEERLKTNISGLSDWDAARIFLEVVRCGSFRSAAERLSLSINVVRRRIDDFERQTGTTLFTRDVHGTHLTDEGALVVSAVERMEAAAFDVLRTSDSTANALSGEVSGGRLRCYVSDNPSRFREVGGRFLGAPGGLREVIWVTPEQFSHESILQTS